MKKYLAIVLGVVLVLGFAVVASAQDKPEITLGGNIMVRGWYFDNVSSITPFKPITVNLPVKTESQAGYTTDATITIDAKVSDNVRGFMELETTSDDDPTTNPNTGEYIWGTYDTKPAADLFFRQLWIQYTGSGLLGVPAGIKAGHQLLTLGEKQFLNHERFGDDAILLTVEPTKELLIGLLTAKLYEGYFDVHRDDIDAYVLLGTYKLDKDNTVGLNYTLVHSDGNTTSPFLTSLPSVDTLNFQNIGLHANGKVTGLSYAAEVDFQFGKAKDVLGEDAKFSGYGIFAKLGYNLDPVTLRASFAMGSGDSDTLGDYKIKEFQTLQGPDDIGPISRFVHYTQIYERTVSTTAQDAVLTTGNTRNTGIANTTYYNLGLDVNPVKDLSLSLDGFIIRATKNEFGSKSAGTEVDFKGTYKIAKNLSYFVEAGVFTPGKYYEDTLAAAPFGIDIDKKTVTQAVHGLCLTF